MNFSSCREFFKHSFSTKYDLFLEKFNSKQYLFTNRINPNSDISKELVDESLIIEMPGVSCNLNIQGNLVNRLLDEIRQQGLSNEPFNYFNEHLRPRFNTSSQYSIPEGKSFEYVYNLGKVVAGYNNTIDFTNDNDNLSIWQSLKYINDKEFKEACTYVALNEYGDGPQFPFTDLVVLIQSIPLEFYLSDQTLIIDIYPSTLLLRFLDNNQLTPFNFFVNKASVTKQINVDKNGPTFRKSITISTEGGLQQYCLNSHLNELDKDFDEVEYFINKVDRIKSLISYFFYSHNNLNSNEYAHTTLNLDTQFEFNEFPEYNYRWMVESDPSVVIEEHPTKRVILAKEKSLVNWPFKDRKNSFITKEYASETLWSEFLEKDNSNNLESSIKYYFSVNNNINLQKLINSEENIIENNTLSSAYVDSSNVSIIVPHQNPKAINGISMLFRHNFYAEVYSTLPFVYRLWEETDQSNEDQVEIFYQCLIEFINDIYLNLRDKYYDIMKSYVGDYIYLEAYEGTDFYLYFKTLDFTKKWELAYNLNNNVINEESLNDFPSLIASLLRSGKSLKNVNKKRKEIFSRLKWEGEEPPKWIINKFYKGFIDELNEEHATEFNNFKEKLKEGYLTQEDYDSSVEGLHSVIARKESLILKNFLDTLKYTWGVPEYRNIFVDAIYEYPNIFSTMKTLDFIKYYYFAIQNYAIYSKDLINSSDCYWPYYYNYNYNAPRVKAYCINQLSLLSAYSELQEKRRQLYPSTLQKIYDKYFTKFLDKFNISNNVSDNFSNIKLEACRAIHVDTLKENWESDVLLDKEDMVLMINTLIPILNSINICDDDWIKSFNKIRLKKEDRFVSTFNQHLSHVFQDSFYVYTYYSGLSPLESKESFASYIKELRTWYKESLNLEQDFLNSARRLEHYIREIKENIPATNYLTLQGSSVYINVTREIMDTLSNVDFSNQLYTSAVSQLSVLDSLAFTGLSTFLPSINGSVNENAEYYDLGFNTQIPVEETIFSIEQILDKTSLADEGKEMRHCVGGYNYNCQNNTSFIFKVIPLTPESKSNRTTIELNRNFGLVQNRSYHNGNPSDANKAAVKSFERRIKRLINSVETEDNSLTGIDKLKAIGGIVNLLCSLSNLGKEEKEEVVVKKVKEKKSFIIKNNKLLDLIKEHKSSKSSEEDNENTLVF